MQTALNFLKELSKLRSPVLDTCIQLLTRFGEELIIFAVICLFYWCISKSTAYKLGLTFFTSAILVQGLKISCRIERPWVLDPAFKPVESAIEAATGYSFPSGHTQSATSLYGTAAFITKKVWLKVLFVLLALGVGFSRLYLGVHTYFDVGAALIITFAVAALVCLFHDKIFSDKNTVYFVISLGLLSVALAVLALILSGVGYTDPAQIDGCFKTGGAGLAFAIGYMLEKRYVKFEPQKGTLPFQAAKLIVGVLGALFFKSVVKLMLPDMPVFDFIRYFLTIFWVIFLFPLIFTRVEKILSRKNTKAIDN